MEAILSLIHVGAGVVWAGGVLISAWFLLPAATEAGPGGAPFMTALVNRTKFTPTMLWASAITVLAGIGLWGVRYGATTPSGFTGLALVIGAAAGVVALGVGHGVQSPTAKRLGALMAESEDDAPTAEQATELNALREKMSRTANLLSWLMVVAIAGMALAG